MKSRGAEFGLSRQQFDGMLREIAAKCLPADSSPDDCNALYGSLKIEELALARACAAGSERAWEIFLQRYRVKLYDMAISVTREASSARELADSLYADLYGTNARDGERVCKLASYTGRGSLEGWLRTVLAQEHVNRYRRVRRLVSLDEENEDGERFAAPDHEPTAAVDQRVERAVDETLNSLTAEDRFILSSYYLDGRTLAQIATLLRVHESTISRKLDKLAKSLRKQIVASLVSKGMSRRQAEEAMEIDVRDLQVNIRDRLAQKPDGEAFSSKKPEEAG